MRQITKFLMVLALIALPMGFTSCDTEDDYYPPYSSLVTEAVQNYWRAYPGGTDYYTTREWFLYYYPMATAAELADFMDAVNYDYVDNYNPSNNDPLLNEVQMLSGEWAGNMTIAFDENGQRLSQTFHANMKFFQYESSKKSLSGHGTEVDTANDGSTQTLDFSWYIDKMVIFILNILSLGQYSEWMLNQARRDSILGMNLRKVMIHSLVMELAQTQPTNSILI